MSFLGFRTKADYWQGMYNSLRQQFDEADDAHVKTMMERDHLAAEVKDRDEAIERYVKTEADLLIANEKLRGQLMEKHSLLAALQNENGKLQADLDRAEEAIVKLTMPEPLPLPVTNETNSRTTPPQKPVRTKGKP